MQKEHVSYLKKLESDNLRLNYGTELSFTKADKKQQTA